METLGQRAQQCALNPLRLFLLPYFAYGIVSMDTMFLENLDLT
jgi:hypothetical protein